MEPGAVVELSSGVSISVSGELQATGAAFTWADGANEWRGIDFSSTSSGSRLEGCTIEHASGLGSWVAGAVYLETVLLRLPDVPSETVPPTPALLQINITLPVI